MSIVFDTGPGVISLVMGNFSETIFCHHEEDNQPAGRHFWELPFWPPYPTSRSFQLLPLHSWAVVADG